jgi:Fe-S-cluster formation regulator IscX/YfhJ
VKPYKDSAFIITKRMFVCKRCQFSAATKALLKRHLKKKVPCKPHNCNDGNVPSIEELLAKLEDPYPDSSIDILPYGEEDMNAIPEFFIRSCFMNLEFGTVFENLHKDPDFPQNNNIKMKAGRKKALEVYMDGAWVTKEYDEQIHDIILRIHGIFDDYQRSGHEKILEDMTEEEWMDIQKELDDIKDSGSDRYAKVKAEIVNVLVAHK